MAYIGNPPAEAYTTTVKDSFSGNGSTVAFTLSRPSLTNDVRVVVENVIQDPTVAYSVSGTTLTFTSAPPSGTDNIYVVHLGPAVQTTVPPGEISAATTFASNVTVQGAFTSRGIDDNATSTAMTLDASGNLLVGHTSPEGDASGTTLYQNGQTVHKADGAYALELTRSTTDGNIAIFRKDGTTVGSIGANGGRPYLVNPTYGGLKIGTGYSVDPAINSTGAGWDNSIDLGAGGTRWKNLYLSGGVYLGGTGSANLLDDYEYGDYQVSFTPSGGGSITVSGSHNDLKYTKIGSRVFVSGKVDISAASSPSGYIAVTLPFVIHNSGTANDSRRFNGSIWVTGTALSTYEYQIYGIEGESSVRIYNGSGNSMASTSANQFSGDEGVAFSFHYETTP
jgi:hypothetical protein